ncbi:carbohydrate ABC transporter permease [Paenibacillus cisolokensis]|jgi:ABC-type sugar transport system, permease component|uniref:Sugar ABC transporter permease n=1 Tax=Paenibacillus cisolokensis TaxID=1658519 RepID=A0ABQ4NE73_9BACL|nr:MULTISPECIES: carbohydrate ABC transporter permease [Paenibacillus]ALS28658.1 ABC transporter permease [Paenibacillus sp. 32O-W]GIQ66486.1 sugar ABC transporter permease [Paenibacillus cisolokensis]
MRTSLINQIIVYAIIITGALLFVFPFIYMILTTFFLGTNTLPKPDQVFSVNINFTNYITVWNKNNFVNYFMNSVIVTSVAMVGSLLLGALTAYGFARFTFPGKELIFRLFLLTIFIPGVINIIPQFVIIKEMGLVNTYSGLWLVYIAGGVIGNVFFLRGFFESIPKELEESVLIDGGGNWRIFWNIYLPQSLPALGTLAIFIFQGTWEEYFLALTLIKSEALRTLPIAILMFNDKYSTNYGQVFAASVIALLPVILLYMTFQKKFVQSGYNEGGVKG